MHTCHSDGKPTPVQLVDHVLERTDLDVIAVTDHDTVEGGLRAREAAQGTVLQVIVGEEVSSRHGHILGLFLERRVKPGQSAAATVEAIHDQGGIAIAAHPFWRTGRAAGSPRLPHGVGWLAAELGFDALEIENSTPGLGFANLLARHYNLAIGLPVIASSDAHIAEAIGKAYTSFPGRTPEALREAITKGSTQAHRRRYDAVTLVRYAAWGLQYQRGLAAAR